MILDPQYAGYFTALGLGLLIGVVRERQRDHGGHTPAGMRTHTIAALGGAVAWTLGLPVFLVLLAAMGLLAYGSYRHVDTTDPG
ncbi:MAG: MgtC/SapB family protein, partial [Betaproteobacteria bacterium]